jgi:CheY-like chemotaxis protein
VVRNGQSLAGATLTDFKHRKRYYVLRDAEGRPLTTTGLQSLQPRESVTVFWQFPAPNADAPRLTQVFGNLLSNAIKFTPAGGRIDVDLEIAGHEAIVTVRDTGAGIAPDFLPFVFDMFRQEEGERRQHGGLGIGLALARRLTELHRGTIRARSEGPGKGTEMIVTLPVFDGVMRSAGPDALDGVTSSPRFDTLSVLVVEDTDDTRTAACAMLEDLGANVTRASDGLDALGQLDAGIAPDVVLCDLRMPAMDGFEFLRRLREHAVGAAIPVIACSGLVATDDERKVLDAGFAGYLRKPFDYEALADVLDGVARRETAG